MTFGLVKWYDPGQGYGYILHGDGHEVYFHHTAIVDKVPDFPQGSSVVFDLIETRMGPEACNVMRAASSCYL